MRLVEGSFEIVLLSPALDQGDGNHVFDSA